MPHQFRCVIIGGGPVGLVTAHALTAAGLDWVLLERHEALVNPTGASVVMYPHTLRVMDQLGLLQRLSEIKSTMERTRTLTHEGVCYRTSFPHAWSMEK